MSPPTRDFVQQAVTRYDNAEAARGYLMLHEEKTRSRVELAQRLFKEYYASCFWHFKRDLVITESMIPMIVRGLCASGGLRGMAAAAQLQKTEEA